MTAEDADPYDQAECFRRVFHEDTTMRQLMPTTVLATALSLLACGIAAAQGRSAVQAPPASRGVLVDGGQGVDRPAPRISEEAVEQAIRLKVKSLYNTMKPQGHWERFPSRDGLGSSDCREYGGRTALVVLALLYADEDWKNDTLTKPLKFLMETELTGTYAVSLRASVWSKIKDPKFRQLLKADARFLIDAMTQPDGTINGFFSYGRPGSSNGDHSNTQYGVLGLRDAAIRGIEIDPKYWKAIEDHMIQLQYPNGGWSYVTAMGLSDREPYENMTVSGLANLYITLDRLSAGYEGRFNGKSAKGCGHRQPPPAIEKAKGWLDAHMAECMQTSNLYFLYGLERCGSASGRKTFGGLNWFEEGALWIIANQQPDGSNKQKYGLECGTSWALLFLCKGRGPVLFNKLDTGADWQNDPLDIPNLSAWIGEELEQRINWQVVDLKDPVHTWLDAPILFFNGHDLPRFTDEQKKKLRLYTDSGGTLVAEACCSAEKFTRGFRDLAREVWPEWELQLLDRTHPVVAEAHFAVRENLPRIYHLNDGCRSRVFLIAGDMSCAWQQNINTAYKHYFQCGLNLARYASDKRMMRNRLFFQPWELDELRAKGKPVPQVKPDRGKARLVDWPTDGRRSTDIRAMRHLAESLDADVNVALEVTTLSDQNLGDLTGITVLHMSGHHSFAVSDENLAKVRRFLDDGGLLWADAQCGRKEFDESFRTFAARLLPGRPLQGVLATDPVITGQGLGREGFNVSEVVYKRVLRFELQAPKLEEIRVNGRRVVLYSPLDLTCGLDGHDCWACRGPERNECLKMGVNIVLSAMGEAERPHENVAGN
ncbi:MAG: DUF4159 domain-containing protein [Phycisphaerae bacterium]|nr:DUF4159 domain-containing protein [Phycisphaerae bacterium]